MASGCEAKPDSLLPRQIAHPDRSGHGTEPPKRGFTNRSSVIVEESAVLAVFYGPYPFDCAQQAALGRRRYAGSIGKGPLRRIVQVG